jgi:hypothetical protein
MKRCPACNRIYTDETLRFCLDDGVALFDEQATSRDPYETLLARSPCGTDPTPTERSPAVAINRLPQSAPSTRRKSFILVAAIAAAFAVVLGVITYLYLSRDVDRRTSSETTANTEPSPAQSPEGRWFIILGTYPKTEMSKANERVSFVKYKGYDAHLINTDDYPNLKDGSLAVVLGPYRKDYAQELFNNVRAVFSDAYVKSGW